MLSTLLYSPHLYAAPSDACKKGEKPFIKQITAIANSKDWNDLRKHFAKDFRSSFGPESGEREFIAQWHPEVPTSALWQLLQSMLTEPPHEYLSLDTAIVGFYEGNEVENISAHRIHLQCEKDTWVIRSILAGD